MYPKVSILIPCYNHAHFVEEALDSVVADEYPNKEIIIVDDGSRDNSPEVIRNWIENNNQRIPIHFVARENKGLCSTLNELLKLSDGKYIVLLASDDLLYNNTIGKRVNILEENPDKLVLVADSEMINDNGEVLHTSTLGGFHKKDKEKYFTDEGLLDEILFNFGISGPVVMADKRIYEIIGLYPENLKAEDLYFYSRAAILKKIIFKDLIVSKYRWHSSNISGNQNPILLKTTMDTYFHLWKLIPGLNRKLKVIKKILWIIKYFIFNKKMRLYLLKNITK